MTAARRMGVSPATLLALPLDDLIDALALDRWQQIIEHAQSVYALPDTRDAGRRRTAELRRLARSDRDADRYAAELVTRWLRQSPS